MPHVVAKVAESLLVGGERALLVQLLLEVSLDIGHEVLYSYLRLFVLPEGRTTELGDDIGHIQCLYDNPGAQEGPKVARERVIDLFHRV